MKKIKKLFQHELFKSSAWIMSGSIVNKGALLIYGIFLARKFGDEFFGTYGLIKNAILTTIIFSSIGLNIAINKIIAKLNFNIDNEKISRQISQAFLLVIGINVLVALLIYFNSEIVSKLIFTSEGLSSLLKISTIVILTNSISNFQEGVLYGLKEFKYISIANIVTGILTLTLSIAVTFYAGMVGAILSLGLIQMIKICIYLKRTSSFVKIKHLSKVHLMKTTELLNISIPISLQEIVFAASYFLINILIVQKFSVGDLAYYTAALHWNSIILFVPVMLKNVFLSHLSSKSKDNFNREIYQMLIITFITSIIPALFFYILTDVIEDTYGDSFNGLSEILRISIFLTIFTSISNILSQALISLSLNWTLFILKFARELLIISLFYWLSQNGKGYEYIFYVSMLAYFLFILFNAYYIKKSMS